MSNHTPAPWISSREPGRRGTMIRHATERSGGMPNNLRIALVDRGQDAGLIAAAPELYEALRNITQCAEAGSNGANMDLWIMYARVALAKARGES